MMKIVMVSGCFDTLHSGHVAFLNEAAKYGNLHVSIGSDANIEQLKGKVPLFTEQERQYIVSNLSSVTNAFVSHGTGLMDFVEDFNRLKPQVFVVNEDGDTIDKNTLCEQAGTEYVVLKREPKAGLPPRTSSEIRASYYAAT